MKRILTIQDISCFGKCSITISLPVISAMGVETVILPTALFSTHTMFPDYVKKDLAEQMLPIAEQWKRNGITFDAIYTAYLGTEEEIDKAREIIGMFRSDRTLLITDPVMGDNGKLYRGLDAAYASKNAQLCGIADLIVPNITEACLMTGREYREDYGEAWIRELCEDLCRLGAKTAVITGVSLSDAKTGFYGMNREDGSTFAYQNGKVPASYHGTGDLFTSTAVGAMMNGLSVYEAMKIAADHTAHTIRKTLENPGNPWYGVDFEATIPELVSAVKKYHQ